MLMALPILLIVAIIVVFVVTAQRESKENVSTTKRLYFYLLSFAALLVAANGLILLLNFLIDRLFRQVILSGASTEQLGLSLAFLLVGSALWVPHWAYIQSQVRKSPAEAESSLRKLYIYAIMFISLVFAVISLSRFLGWAFRIDRFNSGMVSALLVWVPLWLYHWQLERKEGQPTPAAKMLRRWYTYLTSFYSLAMVATGVAFVVFGLLRFAYDNAFTVPVLAGEQHPLWGRNTRFALSVAIAGAPVWVWHWFKVARGDPESTLRQVYLYLYAILLGALTILTSLALIIFAALSWAFGSAKAPTAVQHFRSLPAFVAPLALGVALWVYHWNTVQRESRQLAFRLLSARRAYTYFMAALGLGTAAAGVIILVPTVIDLFVSSARSVLAGADWWRNRTSWILTLLMIGGPWWTYYWLSVQKQARAGGAEERAALTRRLHIYIVLVLSMLALLGSLVFTLYLFLKAGLGGTLSVTVLQRAKWGIGVSVTAALIANYYWAALRDDLAVGAEKVVRKNLVTVVAGRQGKSLALPLEEKLGYRVKVIERLEPEAGPPSVSGEELEALTRRIKDSPGGKVFVVVGDDGIKVYSYD